MRSNFLASMSIAVAMLFQAANLHADVIYVGAGQTVPTNELDFGPTTAPTTASGVTASNLVVDEIDTNEPLRSMFGSPDFGRTILALNGGSVNVPTFADANLNNGLNFTLSATDPAEVLDLGTLSFNFGFANNNAAVVNASVGYVLQASVDGGATFATIDSFEQTITAPAQAVDSFAFFPTPQLIDLNSLDGNSSVDFRLTPAVIGAEPSTAVLVADISINGTSAVAVVPEPVSGLVLAGLGLGLVARRRR